MKIPSSNLNEVRLLDRAVLVLNANYSPMMICTAKRAICLDYLDKIDILANYNEKVSSPSLIRYTSVIKIKNYVRYDNLSLDLNEKYYIKR